MGARDVQGHGGKPRDVGNVDPRRINASTFSRRLNSVSRARWFVLSDPSVVATSRSDWG